MSREAIENTIRAMRDRTAVAYLRHGILGNVSVNAGRRAEDICEMFAGRIEADVADILAENARLKAALKPIIDFQPEPCGNYGEEEAWDSDRMMEAMVESRRIYNGGEE